MDPGEAADSTSDRKHSSAPVITGIVFLTIYFLFPVILVYPLFLVYGKSPIPSHVESAIAIVFYPEIKLEENSPAYGRLLEWEGRLLGMN